MPYEMVFSGEEPTPNEPDFGDEAEYDYIVEQGLYEADQWFGTHGDVERPAKWLNRPRPVDPDQNVWDFLDSLGEP